MHTEKASGGMACQTRLLPGIRQNRAIDIIGQLVFLGVRNIVGDMRAEGIGSAGFYRSRLRSRVEQIFRKSEETEGGDKNTPESEEKIASDREERFAKHFQNPCRRESLVIQVRACRGNSAGVHEG